MPILSLTVRERTELEHLARTTADADQLRRINALLALDSGQGASQIARTQRVGRSTIYEWAHRFLEHRRSDLGAATTTRTAPGRSRELRDRVVGRVDELLVGPPAGLGYRHTNWTTDLLVEQLRREGVKASDTTVRRALHEAGYRWKRPRFVLSRRSPTWRQAKGGSGGASRHGSGRRSSSAMPRS
ncbi:MAG TPA: helix-turn-helix domain-containing protein [Gemmataceae bacterium]|nr:helix-turn-helix domain-containing protein [Gemmataceae bacterium]